MHTRLRNYLIPAFGFVAMALTATVASAVTYTVTLTNGTTFETRYRPVRAEWDDTIALISTDRGNQIAIARDEIAGVTSDVEASGFGYQVSTTTLFVGWSPNEGGDEEGEGGEGGGEDSRFAPEPPQPSYTLEQFVNPGQLLGGVPADTGF